MVKIKYYFRRLKALDYKNMWKTAGTISKKTKRFRIVILFDMLLCSVLYQAGYTEYEEYEFYLLNRKERETYMTTGLAHQIIMKYNRSDMRHKFSNKDEFNRVFRDFIGRDFLDIRTSTPEDLEKFMNKYQAVMAKKTDAMMGDGVERIDYKDVKDFKVLHTKLSNQGQYLIEEYFIQHEEMSALYPESVNTLRMITFFDGKDVHVLEGVLKIGNGSALDNFAAGGMYTLLDEKGVAQYAAFDKNTDVHTKHPVTGKDIIGFQVPLYDLLIETLDRAARVVPEIQYVGWDVAIGQNSIAIIEGNYNTGVFQMKPSITGIKEGLVPKYRHYIDF